jgi:hypothetical protein
LLFLGLGHFSTLTCCDVAAATVLGRWLWISIAAAQTNTEAATSTISRFAADFADFAMQPPESAPEKIICAIRDSGARHDARSRGRWEILENASEINGAAAPRASKVFKPLLAQFRRSRRVWMGDAQCWHSILFQPGKFLEVRLIV